MTQLMTRFAAPDPIETPPDEPTQNELPETDPRATGAEFIDSLLANDTDEARAGAVDRLLDLPLPGPFGGFKDQDIPDGRIHNLFKGIVGGFARPASMALEVVPLSKLPFADDLREEFVNFSNEAQGTSGAVGTIAGQVLFQLGGLAAAPATGGASLGATVTLMALDAGDAEFRDSGNATAAVGAAGFELASEFVGGKVLSSLSAKATRAIGKALLSGKTAAIRRTMLDAGFEAGVEGAEEVISVLGAEFSRYAGGVQDLPTTIERIVGQAPTATGGGALGALMFIAANRLSPRARREFLEGIRNAQAERQATQQLANRMSQTIQAEQRENIKKINESPDVVRLGDLVKPGSTAQRGDLAGRLESLIAASDQVEEGDPAKLSASEKRNLEFVAERLADPDLPSSPTDTEGFVDRAFAALDPTGRDTIGREAFNRSLGVQRVSDQKQRARQTEQVAQGSLFGENPEARAQDSTRINEGLKALRSAKLFSSAKNSVSNLLRNVDDTTLDAANSAGLGVSGALTPRLDKFAQAVRRDPRIQVPESTLATVESLSTRRADQLTDADVRALADTLDAIQFQTRQAQKLTQVSRRAQQQRLNAVIAGELSNAGVLQPRGRNLATGQLQPVPPATISGVVSSRVQSMTPDTLLEWISGGENTASWHSLYGVVDSGADAALAGIQESDDAMVAFQTANGLTPDRLAQMSHVAARARGTIASFFTGEVNEKVSGRVIEVADASGQTMQLSEMEIVDLLVLLKDPAARQALIGEGTKIHPDGRPQGDAFTITEDVEASLESAISQEGRGMSQFISDYYADNTSAVVREWSEGRLGYDITVTDRYAPMIRQADARDTTDVNRRNLVKIGLDRAGVARQRPGRVKERKGGSSPLVIRDALVSFRNINVVAHSVANIFPAVESAMAALESKEVSAIINDSKRGQRVKQRLSDTYDELLNQAFGMGDSASYTDQAFRGFANRLTRGLLAGNVFVGLYQPASALLAMTEMDAQAVSQAIAEGAAVRSSLDAVINLDPYARDRASQSPARLVSEGVGRVQSLPGTVTNVDKLFFMIRMGDRSAIRVIARAGQIQAQAEGLTGDAAVRRVIQLMNRTVKRTQPTGSVLHTSALGLESRQSGLTKLILGMFRSQRLKNIDIGMRHSMRAMGGREPLTQAAKALFLLLVAVPLWISGVKQMRSFVLRGGRLPDEDDPEMAQLRDWAIGAAEVNIGNFIFGEVLLGLTDGVLIATDAVPNRRVSSITITPAASVFSSMIGQSARLMRTLFEEDYTADGFTSDPKFWIALTELSATTAVLWKGAPILPLVRDLTRMYKEAEKQNKKDRSAPARPIF